jgi:hypothetical protein
MKWTLRICTYTWNNSNHRNCIPMCEIISICSPSFVMSRQSRMIKFHTTSCLELKLPATWWCRIFSYTRWIKSSKFRKSNIILKTISALKIQAFGITTEYRLETSSVHRSYRQICRQWLTSRRSECENYRSRIIAVFAKSDCAFHSGSLSHNQSNIIPIILMLFISLFYCTYK